MKGLTFQIAGATFQFAGIFIQFSGAMLRITGSNVQILGAIAKIRRAIAQFMGTIIQFAGIIIQIAWPILNFAAKTWEEWQIPSGFLRSLAGKRNSRWVLAIPGRKSEFLPGFIFSRREKAIPSGFFDFPPGKGISHQEE